MPNPLPSEIISILPDDEDEHTQAATFIEVYMKTRDPMLAYVQAGISDPRFTATIAAQNYLRKPEIAAAIAALEKLGALAANTDPRVEITRESVIADFQTIFEKSMASGNFASANTSKKMHALILGLVKTEVNVNHRITAGDLSDSELQRIASQKGPVIDGEFTEEEQGIGALRQAKE